MREAFSCRSFFATIYVRLRRSSTCEFDETKKMKTVTCLPGRAVRIQLIDLERHTRNVGTETLGPNDRNHIGKLDKIWKGRP